jgi:hypothetical protein
MPALGVPFPMMLILRGHVARGQNFLRGPCGKTGNFRRPKQRADRKEIDYVFAMFNRDITEIITPHVVSFSADTASAAAWMRKHHKGLKVSFALPAEREQAVAFQEQARASEFRILALMRGQY